MRQAAMLTGPIKQVTLIAQSLPASSEGADDKEARTRNLYACFDAPK